MPHHGQSANKTLVPPHHGFLHFSQLLNPFNALLFFSILSLLDVTLPILGVSHSWNHAVIVHFASGLFAGHVFKVKHVAKYVFFSSLRLNVLLYLYNPFPPVVCWWGLLLLRLLKYHKHWLTNIFEHDYLNNKNESLLLLYTQNLNCWILW